MMMIVSAHQPDYVPWLGFYYKVARSDLFVYLDDVQYSNSNQAAHNLNVIKTPQGALRLKVPVECRFGDRIHAVRTRDELGWKEKHLKTLAMNYTKAPYFKEIFPVFAEVLKQDYKTIAALNMALNQFILKGFGIGTKIIKSSALEVTSAKEERIMEICKKVNCDVYLSGNGARAYQSEEAFSQKGVKLIYLDYAPIQYKQLWKGFLPCMSVLDYIFNCGFDWGYVEREVRRQNH